jgi:hypothetical protein
MGLDTSKIGKFAGKAIEKVEKSVAENATMSTGKIATRALTGAAVGATGGAIVGGIAGSSSEDSSFTRGAVAGAMIGGSLGGGAMLAHDLTIANAISKRYVNDKGAIKLYSDAVTDDMIKSYGSRKDAEMALRKGLVTPIDTNHEFYKTRFDNKTIEKNFNSMNKRFENQKAKEVAKKARVDKLKEEGLEKEMDNVNKIIEDKKSASLDSAGL